MTEERRNTGRKENKRRRKKRSKEKGRGRKGEKRRDIGRGDLRRTQLYLLQGGLGKHVFCGLFVLNNLPIMVNSQQTEKSGIYS